jgi:hypothetical protein
MAKTRRKKINKSPLKPFRNSTPVLVAQGRSVKVQGIRVGEGNVQIAAKGDKAKPVFIGRVYTGVPRGKTYPYEGPYKKSDVQMTLTPRKTVGVTE